jgi:hypothetical protein
MARTVKEYIEFLQQFDQDEFICLPVFWTKEFVQDWCDVDLTSREWVDMIDEYENSEKYSAGLIADLEDVVSSFGTPRGE